MRSDPASPLRGLRYPRFAVLFASSLVSHTGTWVQRISQDLLVLHVTDGSALALGAVTALQFLPIVALGTWSGAVSDRFGRRRTLIATSITLATLAAMIGVAVAFEATQLWQLLVFALAQGAVVAVQNPARTGLAQDLVPEEALTSALGLITLTTQLGRVLGPVVGILLLPNYALTFFVNAGSFLFVAAAMVAIGQLPARPPRTTGASTAWRFVKADAPSREAMLLMAGVALFASNILVQTALVVTEVFDCASTEYATAAIALSVGAIAGSLLAGGRTASRRIMLAAAASYGVLQIPLGLTTSFPVFLSLLGVLGVCFTLFSVTATATIQSRAPAPLRGRVMSLFFIASQAPTPVGALLVAVLVQAGGTATSLIVAGSVTVLSVIAICAARRSGAAPAVQPAVGVEARERGGTSSTLEAQNPPSGTADSPRHGSAAM